MAILDRIKFDAPSDSVLVWKYPSEQLRLFSQLIVNQAQEAVFVKGGQVADVFGPGTHTLTTANLPVLHTLTELPFGGETPFAAEVWFVNKTVKRDLRWGTQSPIPVMDPEYHFPISVRAYGRFGVRISDARAFVVQVVGTLGAADSAKLLAYFIGELHQRFSSILTKAIEGDGISIFRVNASLDALSKSTQDAIAPEFGRFGVEVVNFNIERVSIPEEELARFQSVFGRRMEIDQISKAKVGEAYTVMRTFDTLEKAAANESGNAGALLAGGLGLGVGVGAGVPLGQKLGGMMRANGGTEGDATEQAITRLRNLKRLLDENLITAEEFELRRKAVLDAV